MIQDSEPNNSNKKPDGFSQPIRFFIALLFIVFLAACSTQKSMSVTQQQLRSSKPLSQKDSIQAKYKADALFMDAVTAKIQDDKDNAFRKFSELILAYPDNATAHYELSRLWLDKNNFILSLQESKKAVDLDSNNKWMQMQYADLLAYDGSFTEAASIYNKIAQNERSPEDYLIRQAALLEKAKKYDEALKVYDHLALFMGEDDETLLMQREQLYLSKNDVEGAANEVRKLIKFYPKDPQYAILLAAMYENNHFKDKAALAYEELDKKFPDDTDAQTTVLRYHLRNENLKEVMQSLEHVVLNNKINATNRLNMLMPFVQNRNIDSSIRIQTLKLIHDFAAQEPPHIEAQILQADVMTADGKLDSALVGYKKAISIDSSIFAPWQQVLYIQSIKGMTDSVIHYARKAAKLFPEEYMQFYLGGLSLSQKKENKEAILFLQKALVNAPYSNKEIQADILIALGDIYNIENNFKASDSSYEASLKLEPNNPTALNNYGYYLSVRGEKLEIAERMSAQSLKLRPDEANFLDTYGWILFKQGKFADAQTYIQKAIDKSGANDDVTSLWEHLGDIEFKLGNKEKALEHWKTAAKGADSEQLKQKIKEQKLND